jgi:hypothetical protein
MYLYFMPAPARGREFSLRGGLDTTADHYARRLSSLARALVVPLLGQGLVPVVYSGFDLCRAAAIWHRFNSGPTPDSIAGEVGR